MSITAHFRFVDQIPGAVSETIRDVARVDSLNRVTIYDLATSNWKRTIERIRDSGIKRLRTTPAILERRRHDWLSPPEEWIGAVLGPDYVAAVANSAEDLEQFFGQPCGGLVKPDRPIVVHESPTGHVACIGDEIIVSRSLLDLLDGDSLVSCGAVTNRSGKVLAWHRVRARYRTCVLANESMRPRMPCALCGTEMVPRAGIWVARRQADVDKGLGWDSIGYAHCGVRLPIVISAEWARQISRFAIAGLSIEPIYAHESPTATLVRSFFEEIDHLFTCSN